MPAVKYPYQNLHIANIKGEHWRDIPQLEGVLQISQFGRVKKLAQYKNWSSVNKQFWSQEKILAPFVQWTGNGHSEKSCQLYCGVQIGGVGHRINIRRMVYHVFVSPILLESGNKQIVEVRDGDGRNCHYKNLSEITVSQHAKNILDKEHAVAASQASKQKSKVRHENNRERAVHQFSAAGKMLKKFRSITDAARKTKTNLSSISRVALGKMQKANGYIWRFTT